MDKLWLEPEKILRENSGINTEAKNTEPIFNLCHAIVYRSVMLEVAKKRIPKRMIKEKNEHSRLLIVV